MSDKAAIASDLQPNRFYSAKEITALLGVHTTTIYSWMNAGKFPHPHRLGPRTVRWTGRQIIDHLCADGTEAPAPLPSGLPW